MSDRVALFGGRHAGTAIPPPPDPGWRWLARGGLIYERVAPDIAIWFGHHDETDDGS